MLYMTLVLTHENNMLATGSNTLTDNTHTHTHTHTHRERDTSSIHFMHCM
jgi:hypothetical protein